MTLDYGDTIGGLLVNQDLYNLNYESYKKLSPEELRVIMDENAPLGDGFWARLADSSNNNWTRHFAAKQVLIDRGLLEEVVEENLSEDKI